MSSGMRYGWPLLFLVALVQSAALFKIVYDRDGLLKTGREITLPVKPLDPRDLFRGDYVTLGYDISTVTPSAIPVDALKDFERDEAVFVTLAPGADGTWAVSAVSRDAPANVASSEVVLKGRVASVWQAQDPAKSTLNLRYGIETYFVPEGTGRALESKVREHKIDAILAVADDGTAALKGLVIDGERHVDPPLL